MTDTLDRIIECIPSTADDHTNTHNVLYASGDLTEEDAHSWRALVSLTALPETNDGKSGPVGIFSGPGHNFLLATIYHAAQSLMIEYVLIPRKLLHQAAGNVEPLLTLAADALPLDPPSPDTKLVPLDAPVLLPWSIDERLTHFQAAFEQYAGSDIDHMLGLLAAALDDRHLLVHTFPGDTRARVAFVQALMALLPAHARAELTFSTHIGSTTAASTMIVFAEDDLESQRLTADFLAAQFPETQPADQPYVALLRDLWQGDAAAFIHALADLEPLADAILPGKAMNDGLNQLAAQVRLNQQVEGGEDVDPEALKATLTVHLPLPFGLTRRYSELLLGYSLASRDTDAGLLVALRMDEDPDLDEALQTVLADNLQAQPDAVYVFVRTRLSDAVEADDRWIERLQTAAQASLEVAINDADSETIVNWLRLIAREPDSYHLSGILRDGILATQARARTDGDLARSVVTLAIKHAPDVLDTLLADEELLAVLPNNLGLVLRDYAGDPLYTLQNRGPELFLVAMARAARAQAAQTFTPEVIDQLWKIYATGQIFPIPAHYVPESVIRTLMTTGAAWLPPAILSHLGTLMLADGRDELFVEFAGYLQKAGALTEVLGTALHNSQRSIDDVTTIVNQLATADHLDQQAVAGLYVELLELRGWRQAALPLVEQLARMIQQNPALDIDPDIFWNLLEVAMAARSEMVARVSAQRIFRAVEQADSDDEEDRDAQMVDSLQRLSDSLQWSQQARGHLLKWWRDYVHRQPLAHLTRLEKDLENKKSLVECRAVVQTSLAFRRMLGNRTMTDFAEGVNLLFSILEDIAESFDPSPKQPAIFDEETVRSELEARRGELTDHQWHILGKNFKELAALIGAMGDHRSRGNIVRQNVDRQLLTGEQQPESAVDAMKWMAGYLEGVQSRDDSEE